MNKVSSFTLFSNYLVLTSRHQVGLFDDLESVIVLFF
jgi:hypothetical protein